MQMVRKVRAGSAVLVAATLMGVLVTFAGITPNAAYAGGLGLGVVNIGNGNGSGDGNTGASSGNSSGSILSGNSIAVGVLNGNLDGILNGNGNTVNQNSNNNHNTGTGKKKCN